MWYLTMKKTTDQRPALHTHGTQDAAEAAFVAMTAEFPSAEVSAAFEETNTFPHRFPHVIGLVTNFDGSVDFLWSDNVRTPMPV